MALNAKDYIDILDAVLQCVKLEEQQKAHRLINQKLSELSTAIFNSNADKQKYLAICISKLKFTKIKIEYRISTLKNPQLINTWSKLIEKVDDKLEALIKEKKQHSKLISK